MNLRQLCAVVTLCGAACLPATALATYQFNGYVRAHAVTTYPVPGLGETESLDIDLFDKPGAAQWQQLDSFARNADGTATARLAGHIGLLKAYAASDYAACCAGGTMLRNGYADGTAEVRFYDEVLVQGAGLAEGTPVSYRLDVRIDGTLSHPRFEVGGAYSADALAQASVVDLSSGAAARLSWDASRQDTGLYSLNINTQVGHSLALSGMLYAGTYVAATATVARSAEVDFYHSAGYSLAPSVAGLNTAGASGYDFSASAVPEPGIWALMLLGLTAVGGRAGRAKSRR